MKIIEAQASRSFTLKVAKADYKGEERYRPNEDIMVHASLKATVAPDEDASAARRALQAMVDEDVKAGVEVARKEARLRLEEALNPQRSDKAPQVQVVPAAAHQPAPSVDAETRAELRRAALKVQELTGQPVEAPVPSTKPEADKLLADLRAEASRLAPVTCSNTKAHRVATAIDARVAEYSVAHFGKPLCRTCQPARSR